MFQQFLSACKIDNCTSQITRIFFIIKTWISAFQSPTIVAPLLLLYDLKPSCLDLPMARLNHWVANFLRLLLLWDCVRFWLNANSPRLMMAGSSLSAREVPSRLAVVSTSRRQSPSSLTADEVQPPIARWNLLKSSHSPIRIGDGQKIGSTAYF